MTDFTKENIRRVFLVILLMQLFYEVYLHNQKKSRIFKKFGNLKVLSYFRIHLFRQNMENLSFIGHVYTWRNPNLQKTIIKFQRNKIYAS